MKTRGPIRALLSHFDDLLGGDVVMAARVRGGFQTVTLSQIAAPSVRTSLQQMPMVRAPRLWCDERNFVMGGGG
jgi:hypothetical protein